LQSGQSLGGFFLDPHIRRLRFELCTESRRASGNDMWEISSDPLDLFNIILIVDAARNYLVIPSNQLPLVE
jgi:hypothetical protein